MHYDNLESLIRDKVNFSGISNGWNKVFCEVCGDGKRIKGPRGGWLLRGDIASYHCFNCGIRGSLEPPYGMSDDVKKILEAFNVSIEEVKLLGMCKSDIVIQKNPKNIHNHTVIDIPDYFLPLKDCKNHPSYTKAVDLLNKKCIAVDDYQFFLSSGNSKMGPDHMAKSKFLLSRLIIPVFKNGSMIYYQSRDLNGSSKMKYMSLDKPKESAMYFIDRLYDKNVKRIFITEGFFDAFHVNGVAVMENHLTKSQVQLLNSIDKPKIVIPDANGDANTLIDFAEKNEWYVAFPDYDHDIKDVTDCVGRYGRLLTASLICKSIVSPSMVKLVRRMKNYK